MAGADASAGAQAVAGWVENAKVGERENTKTGDGVARENAGGSGGRRRHEGGDTIGEQLRTPFLIPIMSNKHNRLDKCKCP
jgi:hypothetical protein